MTTLIIDTSSSHCLLGLTKEGLLIGQKIYPHKNSLSQTLLPDIKELIESNNLTIKDLASVAAGMGPGSYTGTRVGVIVAKSLSFGLCVPFHGFCSLLAFLPQDHGPFAIILPSRSGAFYLAKGVQEEGGVFLEKSSLLQPEELCEEIKSRPSPLYCDLPSQLPKFLQEKNPQSHHPNLVGVIKFLFQGESLLTEKSPLIYLHSID